VALRAVVAVLQWKQAVAGWVFCFLELVVLQRHVAQANLLVRHQAG
jgi:hypothetical protein